MTETIGILGANGVYARHLIPRLIGAGYEVRALARRPEAATVARASGASVMMADIFDAGSMVTALKGCTIGINLATSLPGPSGRGSYEANDILRSQGTANWIEACTRAGVRRVLQQSIGMVNASGNAEWSDEDSVYGSPDESVASKAIVASRAMEAWVEASDLDWVILRGGLFYGPGTGFDDSWYAMAGAGKLKLPGDGGDFVSLIHIADMASATMAILSSWPSKSKLIACDDEPARWRDLFNYIANTMGQPQPGPGGRSGFPSFRLRNTRIREATGWTPYYRTFREGLVR